jgi:4-amino-4-deoxy-L-arabinose transferase-like glycosyltransferase
MTTDGLTGNTALPAPPPGFWARLWRGRPEDPPWVRPALIALLLLTAVAYIWGLGQSGWANSFYSAAVQAATKSWKALFFGSLDASNFITVDKPPAFLWIMDVSARLFGVNAWSILVPEALEGVATVWLVYAAVRRWFTPTAALVAGLVLASTPVAALMFRYNNPDALMVLLMTGGAYATIRALEKAETRWLVLAGAFIGTAFLAKMLEAFLVVPALVIVYLVAAPTGLGRRIWQILVAAATTLVFAGWWVAIVQLTPASARPYIDSSQNNSLLNLIFGYNGIGRLTGNEAGSVHGPGILGSIWGPTGLDRLFLSQMGGQISWLVPAALIVLIAGLWLCRGRARTDRTRAALILWGAFFVVSALVLSLSEGIIHPYYTIELAPAVGALIGIGGEMLWQRRDTPFARIVLALALAATAGWAYELLVRSPAWLPWLRVAIVIVGLIAAVAIVLGPRLSGRLLLAAVAAGLAAALAGPAAYAMDTVTTPHSGAIPSAGPASAGGGFGGFGGNFVSRRDFTGAGFPGAGTHGSFPGAGHGGSSRFPGGGRGTRGAGFPGAGRGTSNLSRAAIAELFGRFGHGGHGGGGGGGLLDASTPGAALTKLLESDASAYKWVAATVGADTASGYQLATDDPVMAIGGFNGTDPTPTLSAFERYVRDGDIHYFIGGGIGFAGVSGAEGGGLGAFGAFFGGGGGGESYGSAITSWVESHFKAQTVDDVTVYDLSSGQSQA